MVALRRIPGDLPPPEEDCLRTRKMSPHGIEKAYYWGGIANSAARATKRAWSGRRACVDPFASFGVNREKTSEKLSWGSALLALQVQDPFDVYIFGDRDTAATSALATRAGALGIHGAEVFMLNLGDEALGQRVHEVKGAAPIGPKIVVLTGEANASPTVVRMLLPAWEGRRYTLTLIDPPGAMFDWDALSMLTFHERMDVMLLFPEDMDIERNLQHTERLDRYFGTQKWLEIVEQHPSHPGRALREFYEDRMKTLLDYEIGDRKVVRNRRNSELYKLIFASKDQLGLKLWNAANSRTPYGQDELPLDFV